MRVAPRASCLQKSTSKVCLRRIRSVSVPVWVSVSVWSAVPGAPEELRLRAEAGAAGMAEVDAGRVAVDVSVSVAVAVSVSVAVVVAMAVPVAVVVAVAVVADTPVVHSRWAAKTHSLLRFLRTSSSDPMRPCFRKKSTGHCCCKARTIARLSKDNDEDEDDDDDDDDAMPPPPPPPPPCDEPPPELRLALYRRNMASRHGMKLHTRPAGDDSESIADSF